MEIVKSKNILGYYKRWKKKSLFVFLLSSQRNQKYQEHDHHRRRLSGDDITEIVTTLRQATGGKQTRP